MYLKKGSKTRLTAHDQGVAAAGGAAVVGRCARLTERRAQQMVGHESPRSTKFYGRTSDAISVDEIGRILIWHFQLVRRRISRNGSVTPADPTLTRQG